MLWGFYSSDGEPGELSSGLIAVSIWYSILASSLRTEKPKVLLKKKKKKKMDDPLLFLNK